jgi:hypothetical protein
MDTGGCLTGYVCFLGFAGVVNYRSNVSIFLTGDKNSEEIYSCQLPVCILVTGFVVINIWAYIN